MKKGIALILALAVCLIGYGTQAEGNVRVEVIRMDGVSVVMLTPEAGTAGERDREDSSFQTGEREGTDMTTPRKLVKIEKEAFAGIAAKSVEITENVAVIEARAFAECKNLKEIIIPGTVKKIDDKALDGCRDVTVYGKTGTEAERFAKAAGFRFRDPDAPPEGPGSAGERGMPPVELPMVHR